MITAIYINNLSAYNGKKRDELPALSEDICYIQIEFDSFDEAERFCSQFPKSMKLRVVTVHSYESVDNDIKVIKSPMIACRCMRVNNITGEVNEAGEKRMKKFYDAVLKHKQQV